MTRLLKTVRLDLTRSTNHSELAAGFQDACILWRVTDFDDAQHLIDQREPDWVLIDFDYPSSALLHKARSFNRANAILPVAISTVQHSEALAVWALRSRFLDYLVKPVPAQAVNHCLSAIRAISSAQRAGEPAPLVLIEDRVPEEVSNPQLDEQDTLHRAIRYVEQNYHSNVKNEAVARLCGMNPFHFSRLFKKSYGIGFHEFLTRYRLREARRLLVNPNTNITSVGLAVGFNDPAYFSRVFKKYYGQSPSVFLGKVFAQNYSDVVDESYAPCPIERRK